MSAFQLPTYFFKHEIHEKNEKDEKDYLISKNFFVNFAYFVFFVLKIMNCRLTNR